jgi:3-oxoadipate enol-lactonase
VSDLHHEVTGSGPPVVLLHSGFVDLRMWSAQVPALAQRFTVVGYDMRGYGRSPAFDGPYSPVDDLRALLDHLRLDRVALLGLSRGGRIALDFTLTHPERVTALVLAASALSGHRFEIETTPEVDARWEEAERTNDVATMAEIDLEIWAPLGDEGGLRQMALDNAPVNVADEQVIEIDPPAKERLAEVRAPTLVITGDRDIAPIDEIGEMLAHGIPHARRAVLYGDHFPNIRSPDEFNRLVADFLGTVLADAV